MIACNLDLSLSFSYEKNVKSLLSYLQIFRLLLVSTLNSSKDGSSQQEAARASSACAADVRVGE